MNSKCIVIANIGSLGDLHPAIALALELQARGHAVKLATLEFYRSNIAQAGIPFRAIRPNLAMDDPELMERIMHPLKGSEVVYREILLPAAPETYEDLMSQALPSTTGSYQIEI